MGTLPEITDLFARLASHLQTVNRSSSINEEEEELSLNLSISKLNHCLNLSEDSTLRVLDTALSLMCFKAPQVFDSMIEYLVRTIVSVLSSSVSCEVFRFRSEDVLQIGSSIPQRNCLEFMEMCDHVLEKLEGHGPLASLLLHAVVELAVSTPCYRYLFPVTPVLDVNLIDGRSTIVPKLLMHLPRELSLESHKTPLRLLFWYLDPLSLKHDISKILQDTIERPLLCLSKEFHEKMDWRNVVICLVLSPIMFIETRALLHRWFLLTGLASVLELLVGLVSAIMDLISRPTSWGVPMELGSKLPFSNAYFPCKSHLLRTLAGPLSSETLVRLIHAANESISVAKKLFDPNVKLAGVDVAAIDHKSFWALAVNFPNWFYFASVLLFSGRSFQENRQAHDVEPLPSAAARYIAWILSPVSKSNQDLLVDCLTKISEAWILQHFGSGAHDKAATGYSKKPKKPKSHGNGAYTFTKEYNCRTVELWLREFRKIYMQHATKPVKVSASCEANAYCSLGVQQDVLIRRVLLGTLIGWPNFITKDGCELLLHYAATGIILSREIQSTGLKLEKPNFDEYSKREALAGACLVFSLTDIVESMAASFFNTEESRLECIYQVKLKASTYLIKCIKSLIQLNTEEDGGFFPMDLANRLAHWRRQGQELSQFNKDLDDIITCLSHKMS